MKIVTRVLAALFINLALLSGAQADEMADKTQALVKKAVAYAQANGIEKAAEQFNTAGSEFFDGELYVFSFDFNGNMLALGANPKLVGKDLINLKSPDGKLVTQDMVVIAREQGKGWYEYDWLHPQTKKVQHKRSYVERLPGSDVLIGVGYYSAM